MPLFNMLNMQNICKQICINMHTQKQKICRIYAEYA